MSLSNESNPNSDVISLGSPAATTSFGVIKMPKDYRLKGVSFSVDTAITASDTNNYALTLQKGATVIATLSTALTGGVAMAQFLKVAATFASGTYYDGSAGDDLKVVATLTGTLTAVVLKCQLDWFPR